MKKHRGVVVFVFSFWLITALSSAVPSSAPSPTMDKVVDRAVEREHEDVPAALDGNGPIRLIAGHGALR